MNGSTHRYVYGDIEGMGDALGIAEDHPNWEGPSLTWEEARSMAERDLVEEIERLQKDLVDVRNLTEDAFRKRNGG